MRMRGIDRCSGVLVQEEQRIVGETAARRTEVHKWCVVEKIGDTRHIDVSVTFDLDTEVALIVAGPHEVAPMWIETSPITACERRDLGIKRQELFT